MNQLAPENIVGKNAYSKYKESILFCLYSNRTFLSWDNGLQGSSEEEINQQLYLQSSSERGKNEQLFTRQFRKGGGGEVIVYKAVQKGGKKEQLFKL